MAQDDRVCNSCGGALNEDSKFCPACGVNVETPSDVECPSCGEKNAPDSKYCDKCGSLLQEQNQVPPESPSQQPSETTELEPNTQACRVCGNTLNPAEPNTLDEELCFPCYEELVHGKRLEPMYNYSLMEHYPDWLIKGFDRMKGNWRGIFNSKFFKSVKSTDPVPQNTASIKDSDKVDTDSSYSQIEDLRNFIFNDVWREIYKSDIFKVLKWILVWVVLFVIFVWIEDYVPILANLSDGTKAVILMVVFTLVYGLVSKETRDFVINLVKLAGALGLFILCVAVIAFLLLFIYVFFENSVIILR